MFAYFGSSCATTSAYTVPEAYADDAPPPHFIFEVRNAEAGEYQLRYLTPFEWDYCVSFAPYTPVEAMERTLGFPSPMLQETVSEGMEQVYFIDEGEIVCAIVGYADQLGMGFDLSQATWQNAEDGGQYWRFENYDDTAFTLDRSGEYPVLRYGG
jgi:hypothetical protein